MTKKIHVHLIDDLDASEASETMRFEIDGRAYEIDLSSRNAQKFRSEIAPYIEHARKVATYARRRGRAGPGLRRLRGVAQPAPRGRFPAGSGHAADDPDDETTIPDYAGGLPLRADADGDALDGRPPGPDFGE
jgi:hypothetical protein